MKRVTNKHERCLLLKKLRTAVCLQIMLWDQCSKLSEILGDRENDAVLLVNRITRQHGGKELQLSDLDAIQAAFSKINFGAAVNKLNREMQHTLLAVMQSAVRLQKELLFAATSLAKAAGFTRKEALEGIMAFAVTGDTGMELDERDLQELLGEPEAKGRITMSRPLDC
jgi:hypothetical protein